MTAANEGKTPMTLPVWIRDTLDRAWRTWAQTFLAAAGYTGAQERFADIPWLAAAEIATLATIFALLMATGAARLPIGEPNTAALVSLAPAKRAADGESPN